tara:strand:+ start:587 stop:766 length:180 start_codon:yes stop_codon:yes gene_type:complete
MENPVNTETGEVNPNLIYSDDEDYCTESDHTDSDSGSDDCVEETITIARTSDGFYKIID